MPVKAASLFTRLFVIITLMCPDEVACNLMMLVLHAVHLPIRGKLDLLHFHIEPLYAKTKEPLRIPHFFLFFLEGVAVAVTEYMFKFECR